MNIAEEIRERDDEFHKAIANGDAEAMANSFATNGWFNYSGGPPVYGRDAIGEMFRQSVADGLRGIKSYVIREVIEIGPGPSKSGLRLSFMSYRTESPVETPLNYVGVWQRNESGRLEVLADLVSPDIGT